MTLRRWYIDNFPASGTDYELLEAEPEKETVLLSLIVSNYSTSGIARIEVKYLEGATTGLYWYLDMPVGNAPFALDSKMVFEPGDKITIKSDNTDVSVWASGDVS